MTDSLHPADEAETVAAVAQALGRAEPLEIAGNATKRGFGRPVQAARVLRMDRMAGIALYEPEELVLTAGPGTMLAAIEAALDRNRQRLDFEPPDLAPLWGGPAGRGTLGGAIATNLSGPRRVKAGAARDHALGFRAVSGRAQAFKSGGRVVKNVTGFDLTKLMAGSHGTLAVLTEITVKVMPAPETEATVLLAGDDAADAVRCMARAMGAPIDLNAAAHLPRAAAARSAVTAVACARAGVTALRLDGTEVSVAARVASLAALLDMDAANISSTNGGSANGGPIRGSLADGGRLGFADSARLWREIRDIATLVAPDTQLWRLSVPPAAGARTAARLHALAGCETVFDWAGGLIWVALPSAPDAHAGAVRAALHDGGHATLIRAGADVRARVAVFQPQPLALAQLTARTKAAFDPDAILNRGRMDPSGDVA